MAAGARRSVQLTTEALGVCVRGQANHSGRALVRLPFESKGLTTWPGMLGIGIALREHVCLGGKIKQLGLRRF